MRSQGMEGLGFIQARCFSQLHECSMSALATQMQAACTPGVSVVVAELAESNNIFGQMQ